MSQYDKTIDSIVNNRKTKAHRKIVWKIERKPGQNCTQIGDNLEVFQKIWTRLKFICEVSIES